MRTNHRLLLNTEVALENLKNGKVDKEASLHAYMFLLLNPFVFIDDDAFALLSDEERAKLYKIADAAPSFTISKLAISLELILVRFHPGTPSTTMSGPTPAERDDTPRIWMLAWLLGSPAPVLVMLTPATLP